VNKHSIVLNGKQYDAVTGALLGPVSGIPETKTPPPVVRKSRDGELVQSVKPKPNPRPTGIHISPHKPQGGKTLMRRAVKQPAARDIAPIKQHYPIKTTEGGIAISLPKASVSSIDPIRLKRAHAIRKSAQIGRFIAQSAAPIKPRVAPISVAAAPITRPQPNKTAQATSNPYNIFEQALAAATSHETKHQTSRKSPKKALKVTSLVAAIIAIGAIVAITNKQSIEMQVASWQAGFHATTPTFVPNGYQKDATDVEGKSVSINYVSPEDSTMYTLTQEPSDWNSQALLSTIVAQNGNTYRVLESSGRTIYIYNGNRAAWVDRGILYTIAGDAPLSTDQIISIAASI
jgi:Domain of unknown function (DUF4367)